MEAEQRGYTFKRVAGTSAGALIAGLLAAGYSGAEINLLMEDVELTKLLETKKQQTFPFARWLKLYWRMGLYKGDALENWIKEMLARKNIRTFADLPNQNLRIIASDLTNGRLIVLPDDLPNYQLSAEKFSVAKAIRMSCSVPFFFEPITIKTNGQKSVFVDGGVLSNFPMWLFDKENVMTVRPVLGFKLVPEDQMIHQRNVNNAVELFTSLFETMKNAHDSRYISRKIVKNIMFIPVKETSFVDFSISEEQRRGLIESGRMSAAHFLEHWFYRKRN